MSSVGDFRSRSSCEMYDRSTPALCASCSCVIPAFSRALRSSSPSIRGRYLRPFFVSVDYSPHDCAQAAAFPQYSQWEVL